MGIENFDFGRMNAEQKLAVQHIDGPCRVIAGAGSGKTTVLTKRIQYLLEYGISPKNILAITFTKKAAGEMKERLISLVGDIGKDVYLGTFHSFGYSIIRSRYRNLMKERKNITMPQLIDDVTQRQIYARILEPSANIIKPPLEIKISEEEAISFVSWQKNYLIMPNDSLDLSCLGEDFVIDQNTERDLKNIYQSYEKIKERENLIDFDDMLVQSYWILKRDRNLRSMFQNIYKYILVDEFQDTNVAQYKLVKLLADGFYKNVFIVGDARQAIYSWRASKVDFILDFEKDWKNAKTIELNDNYRSTVEVVDLSTSLIKKSTINYPGICRSGRGNHGEDIYSFTTENDYTEADMIAFLIKDFVENQKKIQYSDVAILYRLNAQSRPFEDIFTMNEIPFTVAGSPGFYGRKEIQELMTYLKLAQNKDDIDSFQKIINVPERNIPKSVVDTLKQKANQFGISITEAAMTYADMKDGKYAEMLLDVGSTIEKMSQMDSDPRYTVKDMLTLFVQCSDYFGFLRERNKNKKKDNNDDDGQEEMIINFIESCSRHKTTKDFFEFVQRVLEQQANNSKNKVQLMSLHRSKGLEFNTVFLVGMVNGLLPHKKSIQVNNNGIIIMESIEEERRLCYVGITRAKERLFLSSYEQSGGSPVEKSIFFQEIHHETTDISDAYEEIKEYRRKGNQILEERKKRGN